MATTPELPEWTGGKLANGEFLGYSKAIYGVLCNLDKTALPIGEPLAQLEAANLRLTDFINESQRYGDTSEIAAADATRDYLFKAIYDGVEQLSRIEGEIGMTLATQAKKLFNVLVAYKGAYKHSLTKETEELQGLEFDLQKKPEAAEAVTMLGLQSWFEALSSANQRVDYLYSHRTGERSDREAAKGGDSTDSLRKTAAGLIANIIRRINVFNEVSPSEASAAAANGVAGVIKQYKLVISSHAGKNEEPEPERTEHGIRRAGLIWPVGTFKTRFWSQKRGGNVQENILEPFTWWKRPRKFLGGFYRVGRSMQNAGTFPPRRKAHAKCRDVSTASEGPGKFLGGFYRVGRPKKISWSFLPRRKAQENFLELPTASEEPRFLRFNTKNHLKTPNF